MSLWDGTVSSHIRIRFLCYFVIYDFRLMICMFRMAFPCVVVFNFRLLSLWQDRLLSPCRVVGHSVVSYGSRALVTLCVCVPVWLVVECACDSLWSVVSFGWSVGTSAQEFEEDV